MAATRGLPTGTVTLLFTDVEGSTELLRRLGPAYGDVLETHRRLLRDAVDAQEGAEVDTQGDAFFFAFPTAAGAVRAAAEAQRALSAETWPDEGTLHVRMGVHTGEPEQRETGYVGLDVHQAARIAAAGHGGQIVVSRSTRDLLGPDAVVLDLGDHRLKDIDAPVRLFQLAGDGLRSDFPPLRSLHASNLPRPATRLVDRVQESEALRSSLAAARLTTLTGPGGVGKTRLALEVAAGSLDDFPGGAYFVDLSRLTESRLVPGAIATALGMQERPGVRRLDQIVERLAEAPPTLLVVDNAEHVLDAAPSLGELLERAAPVTILATSREPLRLRAERELSLGPLPTRSGVALFLERARAIRSEELDIDVVAAVVERLEGLPLSIELAAPRVRALPPEVLLERLETRLTLLSGGYADAPERHRTLRATLDWSYELLGGNDRRAFDRLGVFVGGFRLEAAAAVLDLPEHEAADRVASLVDKSLVAPQGAGPAPRYLMLETIREYALEQLDARDELEDAASRHALHFAELAELSEPALLGDERPAWVRSLADDHPNFRAALEWSLSMPDPEISLRLGAALWRFWHAHGDLAEGRLWLERALGRRGVELSPARAKALGGAAALAAVSGDADAARAHASERVALVRRIGDDALLPGALITLANVRSDDGDEGALEEAAALYAEAADAAERSGDDRTAAAVITNLGYLALRLGDWDRAAEESRRALERSRVVGDSAGLVVALVNLGYASIDRGRPEEAASAFAEALAFQREIGDRETIAYCLDGIAAVLLGRDLDDDALRLVAAAAALRETIGASLPPYERDLHERVLDEARLRLGDDAAEVEAEGAALVPGEALEQALSLAAPSA
jgi:predicted ATPase/class 3 adenylate cyclase